MSSHSIRCWSIIGLNIVFVIEFVIAVVSVVRDNFNKTFLQSSENQFFGDEIKGWELRNLNTYFHSLCLISLLFRFSWRPRPLGPSLVKQAFRNFYHTTNVVSKSFLYLHTYKMTFLSMRCMLPGYSLEPRPYSRVLGTAGAVITIGLSLNRWSLSKIQFNERK